MVASAAEGFPALARRTRGTSGRVPGDIAITLNGKTAYVRNDTATVIQREGMITMHKLVGALAGIVAGSRPLPCGWLSRLVPRLRRSEATCH